MRVYLERVGMAVTQFYGRGGGGGGGWRVSMIAAASLISLFIFMLFVLWGFTFLLVPMGVGLFQQVR